MTIKTDVSRFHIHDELTAPEGSVRILKGVQGAAGQVSKFIGVLAGAPAALSASTSRPSSRPRRTGWRSIESARWRTTPRCIPT